MTTKQKETLQNRFIGLLSTSIVFLVAFYFGSFATDSQVQALESKIELLKEKKAKKERVVKLEKEVLSLQNKQDSILTGLCIMDERTCKLKK